MGIKCILGNYDIQFLYDIFLNPSIGFDVVNNSDFVIVDNQIKRSFPIFSFFNFIFLSALFVLENFPI